MEFQLSYFKSYKMMLLSAALNMPENLKNSAVVTGLEKVSFHSNPKEMQCQRMFRLRYNCTHLTCFAMLKILQAGLQQYMNCELPDVQAGFRKGRGTRDQIANIHWIIKKAREFQKNIYFCFINYAKVLWPGRASPSASKLLAFSPGKEQAAGVWET